MTNRLLMAATLVAATATISVDAHAQAWLGDRRYREGIGIRTGNLELHPSLAGEIGYDSNYFQRAPSEDPIDFMRLRITPSLSLSTLGAQRRSYDEPGAAQPSFEFRGGVNASYNEFFAMDSADSEAASQQRDLAAGVDFNLEILPHKPWGGQLYGDFTRTVEPSNNPDSDYAYDRDALKLGAMLAWRPGGGLFDWRLGYEFRYNYFEATAYRTLSNVHHYLKTRGHWRFLPRTALVYDAELGWVNYEQDNGYLNDSQPVRSRIGLNGLVTTHFGFLAMVGWGASFYSGNNVATVQDFDSVIAQAEVKWYLAPQQKVPEEGAGTGLSTISAGYLRDFQDSYVSDYYQRDRGYARLEYFFGGVVVTSLEGGFTRYGFPTPYFANGAMLNPPNGPFTEKRIDAQAFAEYRVSDTVGINTTLRYDMNIADQRMQTDPAAPPGDASEDDREFKRYQIFLGARWFM